MAPLRRHSDFNLADVERALTVPKGWWAVVAILPAARRLSLFFVNRTRITPTQITVGAFLLCLVGAGFFFAGDYVFLVAGAFLFELNYLLDCVDGTVARLTKRSSEVGAYLDIILDQWRVLFCLAGLMFSHFRLHGSISVIAIGLYYLAIRLISQFNSHVMALLRLRFNRRFVETSLEYRGPGLLNRWRRFAASRKIGFQMRAIETDTILFFIGPMLNEVFWGMVVASALITAVYLSRVAGSVRFLRHESFENEVREILTDDSVRRIAVFGTGAAAANLVSWCEENELAEKITCFLDNDPARQGTRRFDRPVYSPDMLRTESPDLVVVTPRTGHWDVTSQLEDMGMSEQEDFIYANFSR